jgi:hypothetical protein
MSVENGLADSQTFVRDLENAYLEMLSRAAVPAAIHASLRGSVSSSPYGEKKFA